MATLSVCGPLGGKRSLLSTRLISACIISVFLQLNLSRSFLSFPGTIHRGQFRLELFVGLHIATFIRALTSLVSSWMLNCRVNAECPGRWGTAMKQIWGGGIILPMNPWWANMDKGLIQSLAAEQEHLIAADFCLWFNLPITQPFSIDHKKMDDSPKKRVS